MRLPSRPAVAATALGVAAVIVPAGPAAAAAPPGDLVVSGNETIVDEFGDEHSCPYRFSLSWDFPPQQGAPQAVATTQGSNTFGGDPCSSAVEVTLRFDVLPGDGEHGETRTVTARGDEEVSVADNMYGVELNDPESDHTIHWFACGCERTVHLSFSK